MPVVGFGSLAYAFMFPDEETPYRVPPELQYLQQQTELNDETLTNWSATHEATPK